MLSTRNNLFQDYLAFVFFQLLFFCLFYILCVYCWFFMYPYRLLSWKSYSLCIVSVFELCPLVSVRVMAYTCIPYLRIYHNIIEYTNELYNCIWLLFLFSHDFIFRIHCSHYVKYLKCWSILKHLHDLISSLRGNVWEHKRLI